jgi:hypothetical protein
MARHLFIRAAKRRVGRTPRSAAGPLTGSAFQSQFAAGTFPATETLVYPLVWMYRPAVFAVLICLAVSVAAQVKNWTGTPKETIWRNRYTNCDKGYAVDLPKGVVAHAGLPPMPVHGFLISAGNPETTAEVTLEDRRIVGVIDEYDALDRGSARAYLNWQLRQIPNKKSLQVRDIAFRGLRAAEASYRVGAMNSSELVVYRKSGDIGLIYVLSLRTTDQNYARDSALYARIRAGFHLLPLPEGKDPCAKP